MGKFSRFTKATKQVLSTYKGGYGPMAMRGAIGGALGGATYGGISDNHTALGMGIVGGALGGIAGREFAGLKAWQKTLNSRNFAKGDKTTFSGLDGAKGYAMRRWNTFGG